MHHEYHILVISPPRYTAAVDISPWDMGRVVRLHFSSLLGRVAAAQGARLIEQRPAIGGEVVDFELLESGRQTQRFSFTAGVADEHEDDEVKVAYPDAITCDTVMPPRPPPPPRRPTRLRRPRPSPMAPPPLPVPPPAPPSVPLPSPPPPVLSQMAHLAKAIKWAPMHEHVHVHPAPPPPSPLQWMPPSLRMPPPPPSPSPPALVEEMQPALVDVAPPAALPPPAGNQGSSGGSTELVDFFTALFWLVVIASCISCCELLRPARRKAKAAALREAEDNRLLSDDTDVDGTARADTGEDQSADEKVDITVAIAGLQAACIASDDDATVPAAAASESATSSPAVRTRDSRPDLSDAVLAMRTPVESRQAPPPSEVGQWVRE